MFSSNWASDKVSHDPELTVALVLNVFSGPRSKPMKIPTFM